MNTKIIAEAGVNHNGQIETALELIKVAAEAGADVVKFQSFKAASLATRSSQKANYQRQRTSATETQFEMLKKLELTDDMHDRIAEHCKKFNIEFLSTAFDAASLYYLQKFNPKVVKIPSGEINNLPYLRFVGGLKKPVIMSTGMATLEEITEAIEVLYTEGLEPKDLTLLHCTTEYPAPMKDVNLNVILKLRDLFGVSVGYSDHTAGYEVAVAAVAIGATVIEKHFTLDKNMSGPDHRASLSPQQLKEMITAIRNIEVALGNENKVVTQSEKKNRLVVRKSIVATKLIRKGEEFTEFNLGVKRPGMGINPMCWDKVLGTVACKDFEIDDMITIK